MPVELAAQSAQSTADKLASRDKLTIWAAWFVFANLPPPLPPTVVVVKDGAYYGGKSIPF